MRATHDPNHPGSAERRVELSTFCDVDASRNGDALVRFLDGQAERLSERRKATMDGLGLGAGDVVLDAGCGPATATFELEERVGSTGHVVGVDLSAEMVAAALSGEGRLPRMEAAILEAVEERARALANAERIEAEIERRAEELAEQKYRSRDFDLVAGDGFEAARLSADGRGQ